jgi:oligopeptide/dipeptide ABC transporter ATP-binding protein
MQIVFQDPVAALNRRRTVEQIIRAPMRYSGAVRRAAREERVLEVLSLVGLHPDLLRRYPATLSGGQCQRVSIARALVLGSKFLVLDEAVSALDVSIRASILNLLRELQGKLGLTYLFISHDLSVVRYMATRIAVIYRGEIVEIGARAEVFDHPLHPYTLSLLDAVPAVGGEGYSIGRAAAADDEGPIGSGCPYRPRCPLGQREPICASTAPVASPVGGDHGVACHLRTRAVRGDGPSSHGGAVPPPPVHAGTPDG